jgi:hypothetical protein
MPNQIEALEVDQFVLEEIDTVPHLEALLLMWRDKQKRWSTKEMARSLYIPPESAATILQDLSRRGLVAIDPATGAYSYDAGSEHRNLLIQVLDDTYGRELIRITRMIHSKAAPSVREFARAFRLKKDKD